MARVGGNEFCLLVHDVEASEAERAVDRIDRALQAPFHVDGVPLALALSMGARRYPGDATDAPQLLRCAGMATRAAKAQEPSKAFFSSALQEDIEARFALQQSREAGFDPGVFSVNVSAEQLRLPGLAQEVIAAARDHRIEPRCLELEITETAFISQATEHVERNVRALRQHGFTVALDDFGTGSPP